MVALPVSAELPRLQLFTMGRTVSSCVFKCWEEWFMHKSLTWMVGGLVMGGMILASLGHQAEARPGYLKEFISTYESLKEEAGSSKCLVCHYGDSKKNRNDYGAAFGEALGAPNIKAAAQIVEALKKAESGKSSVEGKTFGDLIKEGKLPGKNP